MASLLLNSDTVAASQGGGIYSYEAESGSIQFRAGGSFYGSRMAVPVEDVEAFCWDFFRQFGYEDSGAGPRSAQWLAGSRSAAGPGRWRKATLPGIVAAKQ